MSDARPTAPLPIFDVKKWSIRMIVAAAFAVALLVLARPRETPILMVPGGVLILIGAAVRIWGTGHLQKNKVLATGGPYAFIRHPLYLGTFFILVGLGLFSGSRPVLFVLLPVALLVFLIYYAPKKEKVESSRLRKRFGEDFDRYSSGVRGYIPRITPYPHREGRWELSGVLQNREYLIDIAVAFGVAAILVKYFFPDLFPTPI